MKSGKHNTDLLSSEPRNLLCLSPRFSAWRHGKQPVLIYPPTLLSQRGSSFRRSHLKLPVSPPLWALHTVETKINATGDKMLSDLGENKSELKTRQSHVYMHMSPHSAPGSFQILKRFSWNETCQNNCVSSRIPNSEFCSLLHPS